MSPVVAELRVELHTATPFDTVGLLGWLVAHAVPGVAAGDGSSLSRSLALAGGPAVITVSPDPSGVVDVVLRLSEDGDRDEALTCVWRMLDLGADSAAIDAHLAADPVLAPLVSARPGRRIPGAASGADQAVLAILGQQISVAAARTFAGRLVAAVGTPLPPTLDGLAPGVTHLFPPPTVLADADLSELGLTSSRQQTIRSLTGALASGRIDLSTPLDLSATGPADEVRARLLDVAGIGPWTADVIAIAALGDRDVLVATDLVLRKAAIALGLPADPRLLGARSEPWAPYRSYASHHLWATLFPDR